MLTCFNLDYVHYKNTGGGFISHAVLWLSATDGTGGGFISNAK